MKHNFKVGDRVLTLKEIECKQNTDNKTATIVVIDRGRIGLEFDEYINGHDCDGYAKDGHGFNLWETKNDYKYLKLVDSDPQYEIY